MATEQTATNRSASGDAEQITAEDLRQIARALGLVPVPDHLMPKVLAHVRAHRKAIRTFDESGIDLTAVFTAQPYRA